MVPAVGQGALALQVRADDARLLQAVAPLHDVSTARAIRAERIVLAALGGGCSIPLGVLATVTGDSMTVTASLSSPDGMQVIREKITLMAAPEEIGGEIAARLLAEAKRLGVVG